MNFYQLVQVAMKLEKSELSSKERFQKRKFLRGGSSSGKRARDSQVESVYSYVGRGRRQGPTEAPSSGSGMSSGQGENSKCPHCHKWHSSVCRRVDEECFR